MRVPIFLPLCLATENLLLNTHAQIHAHTSAYQLQAKAAAKAAAGASCCQDEDAELCFRVRLGLSDAEAETY